MRLSVIHICLIFLLPLHMLHAQDTPEQLLAQLLQYPSVSGQEKEVAGFLRTYCNQQGLYTQTLSDNDSIFNFSASLYPLASGKPNLVFLSHLDVVPALNDSNWKYPPFAGTVAENYVWGRGAIDCKGLAVMQLFALKEFIEESRKTDLPYNITFLAVSGEEEGSKNNGSELVTNKYLKELNAVALFGEGGSGLTNFIDSKPDKVVFGISVAEKKALWLKLEAATKTSGHGAAAPALYANKRLIKALIKLLDEKRLVKFNDLSRNMFKEMGRLEGGFKGFVIKHIYWDIFWPLVRKYFEEGEILHVLVYNTFVITKMYNLDQVSNQIADKAYATLDCRLLPSTDTEKFIKKVENVVGNKIKVSVISQSPGAGITDDKTIYYTTIAKSISDVYPESIVLPILFPGTTDNNYYRKYNIPVYGVLPVVFTQDLIGSVHNINERISIDQLQKGTRVYWEFINKMMN